MTLDLFGDPAVARALNAAMVVAIGYIGRQFQKNRHSGRERDDVVKELVGKLAHLIERTDALTREVDRDRTETRFLQEHVKTMERELLTYLRRKGVPHP